VALALRQHRAGDLPRAEHLYCHALQQDAAHTDAWHGLGLLACQRGQPAAALPYLDRALALRPDAAGFHLNRGVALQALGRLAEAAASFLRAAELQPDWAEAHNNLANALFALGRPDEALPHWQRALALRPDLPEAHNNLAVALHQRGRFAEAADHAREAVRLHPDFTQAHLSLGNALAELGQPEQAEASYRQALRCRPDLAAAHANLAAALRKQGKRAEALACLREALRLQPDLADAHNELGILLGSQGQVAAAGEHLRRALWLQPDHAEAHNNLAVLLKEQRQFADAVRHFRQALALQPALAEAAVSLAHTLYRQGQADEAAAALEEALRRKPGHAPAHSMLGEVRSQQGRLADAATCFAEALRLDPDLALAHSGLLIVRTFDPAVGPDALLAEHRGWEARHARVPRLGPAPGHDRTPDRPLRVGYVSADLIRHVLTHFFEPVLAHHDPGRVQAFCYADVMAADAMTERLRALAGHWRPIAGLGDAEVAEQVRADGIDILVDLAGHTGTRLGVFARQPAPVQVTYLGYPATTGLSAVHYRLTDAVADPPGEPTGHTEELVRLPEGFCCYAPPPAPDVSPLPAQSNGYLTFGSLHKLAKLNGAVLDLWCAALRAVPSARLLLFRDALRGSTRDYFRQQFQQRGIAEERVVLRHQTDQTGSFLSVYGEVDVLLDTFPWSGHATACEALWMGVPVLTLLGDRHAGRMVASVLTRLGLTDYIARTPEEFVAKAVELAADLPSLADLRGRLREAMRASPLCDGATFTRHLEAAYREMWQCWVEGKQGAVG
jgi:predicted O-linked N-acetylglucosamine transferase (SPINDLY family)